MLQLSTLYQALVYTVSFLHNSPELCSTLPFLIRKGKQLDLSTNPEPVRVESVH